VISFDFSRGVTTKCDNCGGDPECVRFCAPGAIAYKESELAHLARGRNFARKIVDAMKA